MTNDTTTLTGALKEAGETLAANLTTQGVPSTWDEGLTTLIGKVLDITPGPTPSFDGITLTSDKSILSYADSEYATLSAQLTSSGSPASVSGETVTFEVRKSSDDSLVETLTGSTNASGIATVSYLGKASGDLYIQANVGMILSETCSLQDCILYDPQTVDKSRYTVTSGSASLSYGTNGLTVVGATNSDTYVKNTALTLPTNYSLECTVMGFNGDGSGTKNYGGLCFDNLLIDFQTSKFNFYQLSPLSSKGNITYTLQQGDVLKIEMESNTVKIYVNGTLKSTQSSISNTGIYQHRTYKNGTTGRTLTIKDLKVKPL